MRELPLTPQDMFILSLVTRGASVHQVVSAAPIAKPDALAALERLASFGLLQVDSGSAAVAQTRQAPRPARVVPQVSVAVAPDPRQQAAKRKDNVLRAQLAAVARSRTADHLQPVQSVASAQSDRAPTPATKIGNVLRPSSSSSQNRIGSITGTGITAIDATPGALPAADPNRAWQQVEPGDARLDGELGLPLEIQRRVLWLFDHSGNVGDAAYLSLDDSADSEQVRRRYHSMSRWLHPDAHYGRDLGGFRPWMEASFNAARQAVSRLMRASPRGVAASAGGSQTNGELRHASREERAAEYREQARSAMQAEDWARAASLFRVAVDILPGDRELHDEWQRASVRAQLERGNRALASARRCLLMGDVPAAAGHYEVVASAHPSALRLAEAAATIVKVQPARARELAMSAIDTLRAERLLSPNSARDDAELHILCAKTFLKLGQIHTASEQAQLARKCCPEHEELAGLEQTLTAR